MKKSLLPRLHLRLPGSCIFASRATTLPYWCIIAVQHHRQWHLQSCYIRPNQGKDECTPSPVYIDRKKSLDVSETPDTPAYMPGVRRKDLIYTMTWIPAHEKAQ